MKHKRFRFGPGFRVAFDVRRVQAAEMVIAPGDSEGGPDNRHRGADQWLYVVSGTGLAIVEDIASLSRPAACWSSNAANGTRSAIPGARA